MTSESEVQTGKEQFQTESTTVGIVAVKQGSLSMISVKRFNQSEIVYHPGVAKFYDLGLRTFLIYFE